jgi:hypothetical protein
LDIGDLGIALGIAVAAVAVSWVSRLLGDHFHSKRKIFRTSLFGLLFVAAGVAGIVGTGIWLLKAIRLDEEMDYLVPALAVATLTAGLVVEARARLGKRGAEGWDDYDTRKREWNRFALVARTTALYAGALVVAAVIFWPAAVELPSAKVCTTTGFEERGDLIGSGSGGVYLAEPTLDPRLIATYPMDRVEEIFIGTKAFTADCDPRGEPPVIAARQFSSLSITASTRAKQSAAKVAAADDVETAREALRGVATHTRAAGDNALMVESEVDAWLPDPKRVDHPQGRRARDAADHADRLAYELGGAAPGTLREIRRAARRASVAASGAAALSRRRVATVAPAKYLRGGGTSCPK